MGDSKLPPEFPGSGVSGEGEVQRLEDAGLEVFEIAGTIKWFDVAKGYGFIVPDNGLPDVLLHVTCLRAGGYQTAYEGARIHCQVLNRPKGMQAFRILSMDETTAIHPSLLPQRTHVHVQPESDWERVIVKWFKPRARLRLLDEGRGARPISSSIWRRCAVSGSPSCAPVRSYTSAGAWAPRAAWPPSCVPMEHRAG